MSGKVGKELVGSRTYQPRIWHFLAISAKLSWELAPFSPSQAPQARGLSLFVKLTLPSGLSLFRVWLSGIFLHLRVHWKRVGSGAVQRWRAGKAALSGRGGKGTWHCVFS